MINFRVVRKNTTVGVEFDLEERKVAKYMVMSKAVYWILVGVNRRIKSTTNATHNELKRPLR